MSEFSVGDWVRVRAKMTRIAPTENSYTFLVAGYGVATTSSRELMAGDLLDGANVDKIKVGDVVNLRAEVTRTANDMITVRIGAWSYPMTLRQDFVSSEG